MKRVFLSFLFAAYVLRGIGADTIPPELVGAWAPAKAKIEGGVLSEGYAIYLNTNGLAAVVAAPPPVGAKWRAVYDATNHMLILTIDAQPDEGLMHGMTNRFIYDPKAKTLSLTNAPTKDVLTRHGNRIPGGVIEDLQ